jgi:hypothetical protein
MIQMETRLETLGECLSRNGDGIGLGMCSSFRVSVEEKVKGEETRVRERERESWLDVRDKPEVRPIVQKNKRRDRQSPAP